MYSFLKVAFSLAGKQHLPYLTTRFVPKRYEVFTFCIDYLLPGAVSIALNFLDIHSDLKDVTLILLKIACDCVQ